MTVTPCIRGKVSNYSAELIFSFSSFTIPVEWKTLSLSRCFAARTDGGPSSMFELSKGWGIEIESQRP